MAHFMRSSRVAVSLAVVCSLISGPARSDVQVEQKGTVVELGLLCSRTPASWKQQSPTNPMRFMQFALPRVAGDSYDAELVIYQSMDGVSTQKIERWISQFVPPEGKSVSDVATVNSMKVAIAEIIYIDVHGTYKNRDQAFNPKDEQRPNFRLLGVVFTVKGAQYHIRLIGPAKTVEYHKTGFDEWLQAFR